MKGYWANLRPFEKRVMVGMATVLFAVFNLWFVLPHFSDLSTMRQRHKDALAKLQVRQEAIKQMPDLQAKVNKLQNEGWDVPAEEQALQFARKITDEQVRSGVTPIGGGRTFTQTNAYFLEQTTTTTVEGNEQQLIDFLYNLGAGDSMVRVREMNLHPDAPHQKLNASIKLVASYQKTSSKAGGGSVRTATKVAGSPVPASKAVNTAPGRNLNPPLQPGKKASK